MPTVYRNFSALKLLDLDRRFHIFECTNARTVLDLAGAPGGFTQIALDQMMLLHYHNTCGVSSNISVPIECPRPKGKKKRTVQCISKEDGLSFLTPLVISVDQRPIQPLHSPHSVRLQANIEDGDTLHRLVDRALLWKPSEDELPSPSMRCPSSYDRSDLIKRPIQVVLHDGVSVVKGQNSFSVSYAQNRMVMQVLRFTCQMFSHQATSGYWPCNRDSTPFQKGSMTTRGDQPEARAVPRHPISPSLPVIFVSKVFHSSHFPLVVRAFRRFFNDVHVHTPLVHPNNGSSQYGEKKIKKPLETYLVAREFRVDKWLQYIKNQRLHGERVNRQYHHALPNSSSIRSYGTKIKGDVLSMPPNVEDLPHGKSFFWRCVGCQQLRSGAAPCPLCSS